MAEMKSQLESSRCWGRFPSHFGVLPKECPIANMCWISLQGSSQQAHDDVVATLALSVNHSDSTTVKP